MSSKWLAAFLLLSTPMPAFADIITTVTYGDSSVTSLSDADALLVSGGTRSVTGIVPFIDFFDADNDTGEGSGRFSNNLPFLGEVVGAEDNFFAMRNTGYLQIQTPGAYTFGTNSDDGARLRIDLGTGLFDVIVHDRVQPPGEYFGVVNFSAAGNYAFQFTYFENTGQATTELFAAPGILDASSNSFRLIGDTANGGIATAVPESSSLALISVLTGAAVTFHRRRKSCERK